jgi:hypothetical protein
MSLVGNGFPRTKIELPTFHHQMAHAPWWILLPLENRPACMPEVNISSCTSQPDLQHGIEGRIKIFLRCCKAFESRDRLKWKSTPGSLDLFGPAQLELMNDLSD